MSEPDHIEEDLQDLYENAPCGYLSLRTDGRIVKANQTFCRWTGYAADELIGKRLHDFLNIAGRIFYETHFAPLLRMQGFFNEVALDLVKKDGERFPVLVNAAERKDADGAASVHPADGVQRDGPAPIRAGAAESARRIEGAGRDAWRKGSRR